MLLRLVTPTTVRARGAEVRGGDNDGRGTYAILRTAGITGQFEASTTRKAGVEERLAQRCGISAVACAV